MQQQKLQNRYSQGRRGGENTVSYGHNLKHSENSSTQCVRILSDPPKGAKMGYKG